ITMGDPAGVGPEIVAKALSRREIYSICRPIVIGDSGSLRIGVEVASAKLQLHVVKGVKEALFKLGMIDIIDLGNVNLNELQLGKPQPMGGRAAMDFVRKAVKLALHGDISAIVTAPVNKEAVNMAGIPFKGHTELLAELTGARKYAMMLIHDPLRVAHVSTHVSLREACDKVSKDRILDVLEMVVEASSWFGFDKAKIAVASLNPHGGEGGLFGFEEIKEIAPAVKVAQDKGMDVTGPIPADTVFARALRGEFDFVVAMYHDQGHIPVKLLGLEGGVNLTLGLPIIRTSVDHGTAYRHARLRLGTADPTSLIGAIKLATHLFKRREKKA
ncbi:MAG: 4-hydroxythreonine-4-phosphate dehydrogenase PdxA, partial [Candidatus Bathyarchaeia archaeon]